MRAELEQLVMDTLHDRRKGTGESCLVVNEAGIELLAETQEALPVIERVICDCVIPALTQGTTDELSFRGLDYVLGSYLVISRKAGSERAIPFLRKLPQPLLMEAVTAASNFFRRLKDGYNFGVSPGKQLLEFLKELAASPHADLRSEAGRVLAQFKSLDPGIGA